jgi:PAS domain S-box-containing protein
MESDPVPRPNGLQMTSDERFLSFVDNASVGIYRSTPDGQIVMANRALVKMMGHESFEELATRNLEREGYEPSYSRQQFKDEIERTGSIRGLEASWIKRDGTTIFVRESASVIRDAAGASLYYDGIIEDISERKRAEHELRDSEERFRLLTEAAFEAIVITEDGRIKDVNDQGLRMFGYERSEMIGQDVSKFVSPESRALVEKNIRGEVEEAYEHRMVRKDGSTFDAQAQAKMVRTGQQTFRMTALRDITDKKKAENELSRANRALRTISQCNQAVARATNEVELLRAICQAVVQSGRNSFAWVGYAMNDEEKSVRPIAFAGVDQDYVDSFKITWGDSERGRGPTGTAIRTGKISKSTDHDHDKNVSPWKQFAHQRGIRSSLALPLSADGSVLGSLSIYATEADAFDAEEIKLLAELADDTANAIRTLRVRR